MLNTINRVTRLVTGLVALAALAMIVLTSGAVPTRAQSDDAAATYKAKCAMCHGAKADKVFDASKGDAALVDAVLKGIKPKMPSYDQKLTLDQAKRLVDYMKSMRS